MTDEEAFVLLGFNHSFPVLFEYISDGKRWVYYRLNYNGRRSKIKNDFFPVRPKTPDGVIKCLEYGFDLFGLIDAGLAINKTKAT
jgi:hypothetical protein